MGRRWFALAGPCLIGMGLLGCGGGNGSSDAPSADAGSREPPVLADLLKESRAELAKKTNTLVEEVRARDTSRRRGTLKLGFLPGWFEPLVLPCVHDGKFDVNVEFLLPSYVDAKKPLGDPALALHYARYGDHEAALKLAGGQTVPGLDELKLDKNYPVEWVRLVAAYVYSLEQQIAGGNGEAFDEFVKVRAQLTTLLVGKAKDSALGRDLLARGRTTLTRTAAVLKEKEKTEMAEQAEKLFAAPNDVKPLLNVRGEKAEWEKRLGVAAQGRVLAAVPPQRALDLMQMPLARDGAEAVLFFFDDAKQLVEVVVTYSPAVRRQCEQAAEVAAGLNGLAAPTVAGKNGPVTHAWDTYASETQLCPVNELFGGWVRLRLKENTAAGTVPRALGSIHLDNRFETNRLTIAPQQQAEPLVVTDEKLLEKLANPLPAAKLKKLELSRLEGHDLLTQARFRFQSVESLHVLAGPLFAQLGGGKFSNESDKARTYLTLTWEDATTQLVMRMPDDVREPTELNLRDLRDASKAAERTQAAAAHEQGERAQRLQAGKPQTRLPRKIEQYPLGMPRGELLKFIPQGRGIVRKELDDALLVAVNITAGEDRTHLVRQIVARFDAEKKLNWVRVRYEAGGSKATKVNWPQQLLTAWRTPGGAVSSIASPYAAREQDLPQPAVAAKFYHWRDDATEATFLLDQSGVEVTVWDRSAKDEPPAPFTYLPRGPEGVRLGLTLSEAKAYFGGQPEQTPDGGHVFRPTKGPFDAVVVWVDGEQIKQLAGRFRTGAVAKTVPAELEKSLVHQWGLEMPALNWPTRRDYTSGKVLQAMTWHDDVTRYRLYWAESENSPARLWAEWKGK